MNEQETVTAMSLQEKCRIHRAAIRKYLPDIDTQFDLEAIDCSVLDAEYTRQFQSAMLASMQGEADRLKPEVLYMATLLGIDAAAANGYGVAKRRREAWY